MPAHHDHGHAAEGFLGGAVWIAAVILAAEAVSGPLFHSLALLSDAGHMLTDVLSLVLAWYAARLAHRPATAHCTYGYHRAGILAPLFNAGVLILVAPAHSGGGRPTSAPPCRRAVRHHAGRRGHRPRRQPGDRPGSLGHGHAHAGNLNVRSAWLHAMG